MITLMFKLVAFIGVKLFLLVISNFVKKIFMLMNKITMIVNKITCVVIGTALMRNWVHSELQNAKFESKGYQNFR